MALEAADITVVSNPEQLLDAIRLGALDVVVTEHLDLTTLPLIKTGFCNEGCAGPLGEIRKTRSIRVRSPV
jgi:hypothetical protein